MGSQRVGHDWVTEQEQQLHLCTIPARNRIYMVEKTQQLFELWQFI